MDKRLFLFLMMSILPFLSFAQKEKPYNHHDIDAGITAVIPDNFKTGGHDEYISHTSSSFNFRVSYAPRMRKQRPLPIILLPFVWSSGSIILRFSEN